MIKKKSFTKLFVFLKNKFFLASIFLFGWLLFFDKNDIISQIKLTQKINTLNKEKQFYAQEIEANKIKINELTTNDKVIEQFAREKYRMKKDNEDIFVIIEEQPDSIQVKENTFF